MTSIRDRQGQDAGKRLALLNSWIGKYPTSDYADARLQIYVTTYAALNQPDKVSPPATSAAIRSEKPDRAVHDGPERLGDRQADPRRSASGEKAANGLISNIDTSSTQARNQPPPATPMGQGQDANGNAGAHQPRLDRAAKER